MRGTELQATGFKAHFVLKLTKKVMGQTVAGRTAAVILWFPEFQRYLVKRLIKGPEDTKRIFVATSGSLKRMEESL